MRRRSGRRPARPVTRTPPLRLRVHALGQLLNKSQGVGRQSGRLDVFFGRAWFAIENLKGHFGFCCVEAVDVRETMSIAAGTVCPGWARRGHWTGYFPGKWTLHVLHELRPEYLCLVHVKQVKNGKTLN